LLIWLYRPFLRAVLRFPRSTIAVAMAVLLST
jgi:hypothetical protein